MRKLILLICCFFAVFNSSKAQVVLYGTTNNSISKFDGSSNSLNAVHNFQTDGAYPQRSELLQANNGKFYGMTSQGGSSGYGVVFSFDPSTNSYTIVKNLTYSTTGGYPQGSLIQASNGSFME